MKKPSVMGRVLTMVGAVVVASTVATAAMPAAAEAGAPLPVAPYVDMGAWPTPVLSTMATQGRVKGFNLGFVTSFGCKASWFAAFDPRTRSRLSHF